MNKIFIALLLTLNLYSALSDGMVGNYADQYAKDFMDKYTGGFMKSNTQSPNSSNTTSNTANSGSSNSFYNPGSFGNPSEPKPAETAKPAGPTNKTNPFEGITCSQAIDQTNKAIEQFAKDSMTAKDQWGVYSAAQKLNGMSEYLNYGCDITSLKVLNLGKVGVNRTQDKACDKLVEFIEPILKPVPAGVSPLVHLDNIALSQQGFGLSKFLGDKCQAKVVEAADVDGEDGENGEEGVVIQFLDENGMKESIYKIKGDEKTLRALAVEEKVSFGGFLQEKLVGLRTIMW